MAGYTDWVAPIFAASSVPALPSLQISESDRALIASLAAGLKTTQQNANLTRSYYEGAQKIDNLDIAVPDSIAKRLRTVVGWARKAVDPFVERLSVDGFRLPGETDVNQELAEIWDMNGLAAEQALAFTDALSIGQSYWLVGSGDDPNFPRITVESPLSIAVQWDSTGRYATAAWQTYTEDGVERGTLMLPDRTLILAKNGDGEWELAETPDVHNFGYVPLVRMAHGATSDRRYGRSTITPELQSIIDSACRTLLDLEVARELYSAPRWLLLGATEKFFKNEDGSDKRAWDTYLTKVLGLERDKEDPEAKNPEVVQLQTYDPAVFTNLIEMYASEASGIVSAVPQEMGLHTTGNPTSAESLRAANGARDSRVRLMQRMFGPALVEVQQMALRFRHGSLPEKYRRIMVDWDDLSVQTPTVTADALTKYVQIGAVPPRSDVVLKRAGFTAVERLQMAQDRDDQDAVDRRTAGRDVLASLRVQAGTPAATPPNDMSAQDIRAAADAMGVMIRAGVDPRDAAQRAGLDGLTFTGAVPVSLRLPENDATSLEST